jgi:hypothetical protein
LSGKNKLRVFDKALLRRIFELKEEEANDMRRFLSYALCN